MDNLIYIELPIGPKLYLADAMTVSIDQFQNDYIRFYCRNEWDSHPNANGTIFDAYYEARILHISGMAYAQGKEVTGDLLQLVIEKRLAAGKKTYITANCPRELLQGLNPALYDLLMNARVEDIALCESDDLHQSPK